MGDQNIELSSRKCKQIVRQYVLQKGKKAGNGEGWRVSTEREGKGERVTDRGRRRRILRGGLALLFQKVK